MWFPLLLGQVNPNWFFKVLGVNTAPQQQEGEHEPNMVTGSKGQRQFVYENVKRSPLVKRKY